MTVVIPRQYQGSVIANDRLTPKIYWLRLQLPEPINFTPGQYGSFLIDAFRRPLSFASLPSSIVEFVIDVSPGGVASQYTIACKPNDVVNFMAPYGRFVIADPTRPIVFIASGSGIGPIRAQILDLLQKKSEAPLTLVFGNRDSANTFFIEEFTQLAKQHPHFTFIPACSEEDPTWTGERGLVTDVAKRLVPSLPQSDCYICGGPAMVTAAMTMLQEMGIPPTQIFTEKFT